MPFPPLLGRIYPAQSGKWGSDCPSSHHSDPKGRIPPTTISRHPDKAREELHRILAEARAAKAIPWDANRTGLYRANFPQMTGCLPEDEGAPLRFDFETEMARLEAA